MVYLLSQKFLKKNIDKLVAPNRYFLIDGNNRGVTGRIGDDNGVSDNYTNCIILGGLCPETELWRMLQRKKKGEDVSKKKMERYVEEFLKSKDFISAACLTMKAQTVYGDGEDINIFVILPNLVNKYLAKAIKKRMLKIIKYEGDQQFIYTQKEFEEAGKKILHKRASKSTLRAVLKGIAKAEKKYKLDDESTDKKSDDDDDWY